MDIRSLVPLQAGELMDTARRNTGFDDFGSDEWLEGFHIFLQALEDEADLHLLGRLMTRSDILRWLEARLGIEAAYAQHPEIDEEVIDRPVIVTGLARSGTSILFELLARDGQFGSPRNWEIMFPYPPLKPPLTKPIPALHAVSTSSRNGIGWFPHMHRCTKWAPVSPTSALSP